MRPYDPAMAEISSREGDTFHVQVRPGVSAVAETKVKDGRRVVSRLTIESDHVDSATVARFPIGWLESALNATASDGDRPKLSRPDGRNPDRFYWLVARAHGEAVLAGRRPAPSMAAEAGVPVRTATSWIREARRRGKLPPGHRGKS